MKYDNQKRTRPANNMRAGFVFAKMGGAGAQGLEIAPFVELNNVDIQSLRDIEQFAQSGGCLLHKISLVLQRSGFAQVRFQEHALIGIALKDGTITLNVDHGVFARLAWDEGHERSNGIAGLFNLLRAQGGGYVQMDGMGDSPL